MDYVYYNGWYGKRSEASISLADRSIFFGDGVYDCMIGKNGKVIRCDGHGVPELLDAILQFFPLDTYVETPVSLMQVVPGDLTDSPKIWDEYNRIVAKYDARGKDCIGQIERFAFYEEAKKAYAIVATGEGAIYANVMLQKGVVK